VFGLLTKPLIRLLLPSCSNNIVTSFTSEISTPKFLSIPFLENVPGFEPEAAGQGHNIVRPSSLRMLFTKPTHTVHYYWRKFDDGFMRPVFGGRGFVPFVPGSPTEQSVHNAWENQGRE